MESLRLWRNDLLDYQRKDFLRLNSTSLRFKGFEYCDNKWFNLGFLCKMALILLTNTSEGGSFFFFRCCYEPCRLNSGNYFKSETSWYVYFDKSVVLYLALQNQFCFAGFLTLKSKLQRLTASASSFSLRLRFCKKKTVYKNL